LLDSMSLRGVKRRSNLKKKEINLEKAVYFGEHTLGGFK
jgi:hypothetical protein